MTLYYPSVMSVSIPMSVLILTKSNKRAHTLLNKFCAEFKAQQCQKTATSTQHKELKEAKSN